MTDEELLTQLNLKDNYITLTAINAESPGSIKIYGLTITQYYYTKWVNLFKINLYSRKILQSFVFIILL